MINFKWLVKRSLLCRCTLLSNQSTKALLIKDLKISSFIQTKHCLMWLLALWDAEQYHCDIKISIKDDNYFPQGSKNNIVTSKSVSELVQNVSKRKKINFKFPKYAPDCTSKYYGRLTDCSYPFRSMQVYTNEESRNVKELSYGYSDFKFG